MPTHVINGITIENDEKVGIWRTVYGPQPQVLITFDTEEARDAFVALSEENGASLQFLENPHVEEE